MMDHHPVEQLGMASRHLAIGAERVRERLLGAMHQAGHARPETLPSDEARER